MVLSLLANEAVLDAIMDLLVLDFCMDSVRSFVVVEHSASPFFMITPCW